MPSSHGEKPETRPLLASGIGTAVGARAAVVRAATATLGLVAGVVLAARCGRDADWTAAAWLATSSVLAAAVVVVDVLYIAKDRSLSPTAAPAPAAAAAGRGLVVAAAAVTLLCLGFTLSYAVTAYLDEQAAGGGGGGRGVWAAAGGAAAGGVWGVLLCAAAAQHRDPPTQPRRGYLRLPGKAVRMTSSHARLYRAVSYTTPPAPTAGGDDTGKAVAAAGPAGGDGV